jgi:hypothetical protein
MSIRYGAPRRAAVMEPLHFEVEVGVWIDLSEVERLRQALRNASSLIVEIWHELHAASLSSCSTPAAYAAGVV